MEKQVFYVFCFDVIAALFQPSATTALNVRFTILQLIFFLLRSILLRFECPDDKAQDEMVLNTTCNDVLIRNHQV